MPIKFSVIVPTRNRSRNLDKFFSRNLSCLDDDFKLIVVDSSDEIYPRDAVFEHVEILPAKRRGQFFQKMQGAIHAIENYESDFVIFLDDDIEIDSGFSKSLKRSISTCFDPATIGASLNIVNFKSSRNISRVICSLTNKPGRVFSSTYTTSVSALPETIESDWVIGGACVWRASLFREGTPNFPIKGKAYCEDLFLSIFASTKGKFIALSDVRCVHSDLYEMPRKRTAKNFMAKLKDGKAEVLARKKIAKAFPNRFSASKLLLHSIFQAGVTLCLSLPALDAGRIGYNVGRVLGCLDSR